MTNYFFSSEDEHAPGNFGMLDQVAALKWIHENIEGNSVLREENKFVKLFFLQFAIKQGKLSSFDKYFS